MLEVDYGELQEKIGYKFKDEGFLVRALTHSSYANEASQPFGSDYERQEFLGDAVLECISSEFIFSNYPDYPEGKMTKLRASLVCEPALAYCAKEFSLDQYIRLGKGEEMTGGRKRKSIISDCLEAMIGGIYLDGGFDAARDFVKRFILTDVEKKTLFHDCKTALQELVQKTPGKKLVYTLVSASGPDHDKCFVVEARVSGRLVGKGRGQSKKKAEQDAAYNALVAMHKEDAWEI